MNTHDKENVDPDVGRSNLTGILKNDENKTMPIMSNVTSEESTKLKLNRRVSFAPEVTLHKIDFVPQQRRETIGPIPSYSSENSDELDPYESVSEVDRNGKPILSDSSDEEDNERITDNTNINENNSHDVNDNDSDMELTEPVRPLKVDEMELTDSFTRVKLNELIPNYKSSNENSPSRMKVNTVVEEEMDFTESLPRITVQSVINDDTEETMEMTQPLSKINRDSLSTINENDETDMEITKPLTKINVAPTEQQDQQQQDQSPADQSEEPMEMTQSISTVTKDSISNQPTTNSQDSVSAEDQTQSMEMTQPLSNIQVPEPQTQEETQEMEMTQPISKIQIPQSEPMSTEPEPSAAQETVDTPTGTESSTSKVSEPAYSREATPQFPDIQIPIPAELRNKRLSEYDEVQPHKIPKLSDAETVSVPLADVSNGSINLDEDDEELYKDYKNVTLSQFLYDIGITFYDDLEIDKLERFSLSNEVKDFTFDDYVRGNNNLLVYSLFKFMNKELSKNIVDGKKLYTELNDSILDNNPKLFKEFYSSNQNDKILIKLDFLLIKDLSRLETKKIWYNWRIQLIENLIIQLNEKHESLIQDEIIIKDTLSKLKTQFDEHMLKLDQLKFKLNKKLEFKTSYDNYSQADIKNIKQELLELKGAIEKNKETITKKLNQLSETNKETEELDHTISSLQTEIEALETTIQDTKNYELKEIKILNFNFKLLQCLSSIKYLQKDSESLYFQYEDFKIEINVNEMKFKLSLVNNKFHNKWLPTFIIKLSNELQTQPEFNQLTFHEKCLQLKRIINNFTTLDKDMFKLSIKFPLINQSDITGDSIKFMSKYVNTNYKINLCFTIQLTDLLNYPPNASIKGTIIKTTKGFNEPLTSDLIANDYKTDCHVSNNLFHDFKLSI